MTTRDIEYYLATWMFPYWKWIVVARTYQVVSHECDLLALTPAGYAHEVEIKVSLSDVKADLKKGHHHDPGTKIKCLWFAMPYELVEKALPFVPDRAGVLGVGWNGRENVRIHRKPAVNRQALAWPWNERFILARTGNMKYWEDLRQRRRSA
jgi:hypothetical protein